MFVWMKPGESDTHVRCGYAFAWYIVYAVSPAFDSPYVPGQPPSAPAACFATSATSASFEMSGSE